MNYFEQRSPWPNISVRGRLFTQARNLPIHFEPDPVSVEIKIGASSPRQLRGNLTRGIGLKRTKNS